MSTQMNPYLAELYGTAESIGSAPDHEDSEKLAQGRILDELMAKTETNYNDVTDEAVVKVAQELFGDKNTITAEDVQKAQAAEKTAAAEQPAAPQTPAQPAEPAEPEKTAAEQPSAEEQEFLDKVAQADFIGRTIAHAMWQEKNAIEKQAAAEQEGLVEFEKAAEQRAIEYLVANGINPENGEPLPTEEDQVKQALDQRAYELLVERGFIQPEQPTEDQVKEAKGKFLQEAAKDVSKFIKKRPGEAAAIGGGALAGSALLGGAAGRASK